jgi:hypothetical protein
LYNINAELKESLFCRSAGTILHLQFVVLFDHSPVAVLFIKLAAQTLNLTICRLLLLQYEKDVLGNLKVKMSHYRSERAHRVPVG